jgi:hypothetical protein
MRTRILTAGTAMVLAIGLLTATPAAAAYGVEISFPGDNSEFYSPFSGPATIDFTFDGTEPDATFSLRLRPDVGSAIHTESAFVNSGDPSGTKTVQFDWPALSVSSPRTFEVAVYRSGALVLSESFFLRSRLVRITGVTPNPFFPWIDDGYRDTTNIGFNLAANADAEARVYRPNNVGKCCGTLVRNEDLGSRSAGTNSWIWDGRDGGGANLAKGGYFVKIRAEDLSNVVGWSKPFKVSIARTRRVTRTISKAAAQYHHVGPITPLIAAGDCRVYVRNGILRILCQTAKVTVFWRWGLASNERIEKARFVIDNPTNGCPSSIWNSGHTSHESSFTVNDNVSGISGSCELSTARITYSYLEQS